MGAPKPRKISPDVTTGAWIAPSRAMPVGFYAVTRRSGAARFRVDRFAVLPPVVQATAMDSSGAEPKAIRLPSARIDGNVEVDGHRYDADFLRAAESAHGRLRWYLTTPMHFATAGAVSPLLCAKKRGRVVAVVAAWV